jgi:bacillithiol biosynthesis deacetylase BshB1
MADVALVVAPHQDDAEIGMGGTVCALIAQGVKVVVLDLSDGEPTPHGSVETRARETRSASAVLGVEERILLGLTNRAVFDTVENRNKLAEVVRRVRPGILFAPYWEDAHPDHVQASALVDAARFYSKFVKTELRHEPWYPRKAFYFFSTHLRVTVQPSFVFDISSHLGQKMESIRSYHSQFGEHTSNVQRLSIIRDEALYWGSQIGVHAGEPFVCRENVRIASAAALCAL